MNLPVVPLRCDLCDIGPDADRRGWRLNGPQLAVWDSRSVHPRPDAPILLFVGDRPGLSERSTNRPFTGPAGSLLRGGPDSLFSVHRIRERTSVFLCNALRCYTPASSPSQSCYTACRTHLDALLSHLATLPHSTAIVVALGGAALRTLAAYALIPTSLSSAKTHQARPLSFGPLRAHLIVTYNPAAALRNPVLLREIHDHFAVIDRIIRGVPEVALSPIIVEPGPPPDTPEFPPRKEQP